MPRLIAALIRHGDYEQLPDTPSAHQPFPLNARGERQARDEGAALCDLLAREGWALANEVDCSHLLRAWQTAGLMMEAVGACFQQTPQLAAFDELAERGLGSAANLTLQQIAAIVNRDPRCRPLPEDWKSNSHFRLPLPGAESLMEAGQRVADHLQRRMSALASEAERDTVKLFVGHGAAFRHAAHLLGVLSFEQIAGLSMYHAHPVLVEYDPGGAWRHIGGRWKQRSADESYTD